MISKNLVIDFDCTLIQKDSLIESIIKQKMLKIFKLLIIFCFKSRLYFKEYLYLSNLMKYDLEINKKILLILRKNNGYVVSGSYHKYLVKFLSGHVDKKNIFGSSKINLTGYNKMQFLVEKFGHKKFDYIGDSLSDIVVWKAARKAYTVKRLWLYKFFVPNLKHFDEI